MLLLRDNRCAVHVSQALVIWSLALAGGSATLRWVAQHLLTYDVDQLDLYGRSLKETALRALERQGVIECEGDLIRLATKDLTPQQRSEIIHFCELWMKTSLHRQYLGVEATPCVTRRIEAELAAIDPDLSCPLCSTEMRSSAVVWNELAYAFRHPREAAPGHMVVAPRRHTPDFFTMTDQERGAVEDLLGYLRGSAEGLMPDVKGFNLIANCGEAAGQTVPHAHMHLIPRRAGDGLNPRSVACFAAECSRDRT